MDGNNLITCDHENVFNDDRVGNYNSVFDARYEFNRYEPLSEAFEKHVVESLKEAWRKKYRDIVAHLTTQYNEEDGTDGWYNIFEPIKGNCPYGWFSGDDNCNDGTFNDRCNDGDENEYQFNASVPTEQYADTPRGVFGNGNIAQLNRVFYARQQIG